MAIIDKSKLESAQESSTMKTDRFQFHDYYLVEELLEDYHRIAREAV
ncbi:MAG: hypothetical protein RLZZ628_3880, partial [Bacteroidota bacterium]